MVFFFLWVSGGQPVQADGADGLKALEETIEAGEYAAALDMADRMLAAATSEFGPESVQVAAILNLQVGALWYSGKYNAEVQALAEKALGIRRAAFGDEHPDTVASMNSLGNIMYMRGNFRGALETYAATLKARQAILPPGHKDVATSLNNLALAQYRTGNNSEARKNFEQALLIREKVFGPRHMKLNSTVMNIGLIYQNEGDDEKALHHFHRALEIIEKNHGPNHPLAADVLLNIQQLYASAGRYEEALVYCNRGLGVMEKTDRLDHSDAINLRVELATITWHLGDRATAATMFRKALAEMQKVVEPDSPILIPIMHNVAFVLGEEGRYREAETMLRKALTLSIRTYGLDGYRSREIYGFLADLHNKEGNYTAAIDDAVEAERLRLESFHKVAPGLTEAEALRMDRARGNRLDWADDALLKLHEQLPSGKQDPARKNAVNIATEKYWNQLVHSRAAILDEVGARGRILQTATDRNTRNLLQVLNEIQGKLGDLLQQGEGGTRDSSYLKTLEETLEAKARAERALAEKSFEMRRRLSAQTIDLEDVRAALPERTALVAFSTFHHSERSPLVDAAPAKTVKIYFALVLEAGAEAPLAIRIGEGPELEDRIRSWKQEAGTPPSALPLLAGKSEDRYRKAGNALREMLWDPVAARLGTVDQIMIVPVDQINLVSFATLPDGQGGYLAESAIRLHYLSAERDLAASPAPAGGQGLLVLGGIRYQEGETEVRGKSGAGDTCRTLSDLSFTPLPGSRIEATEIATLWARSRGNNPGPVLLTGLKATESGFKKASPGKEILHLATHGFFAAASCTGSGDRSSELTGDDTDLEILVDADLEANPLLLTGLALAGANDIHSGNGDDGLLSAAEIAGLPLNGVQWAVLSACETGLGRIQTAEGVLGMRRAFQIAGVSTLIMSLWPVEDQATREWMAGLYKARLKGSSTTEAVQRATVGIIKALKEKKRSTHPYAWGAFVAAGDYR
ncbi:MAG: CHAT domain-containing protein [Acidobacteria bacterium]|uniref:CHAT domain-containing protein n=1 Tax=Candidatus Polarisedimenticola svalbardensis TaxID=2886004 RepID=A0A8J7C2C5_9BACT|nr:CHAT domain-containing protein [Candidatus Polarisedimenticola svalbardensis]